MKKKKKKILLLLITIIFLVLGVIILGFKITLKNYNTLTLEENKWIDSNKYNVIDIAILNDIPILSYEGEGIVYNYLDYVTKNHSLNFNVVPYKLDSTVDYNYKMSIVDTLLDNQIEILKDNFVLLSVNDMQYMDISEINNLRVGILKEDVERISNYLNNSSITYVEYDNYASLKNSIISSKTNLNTETDTTSVDAIIVLKTATVKELIEYELNIAYQFNDLNKYFVFETNGNKNLNSIIKKTFNSWSMKNYYDDYNAELLDNYYKFKKLSDVEQKTLKSKSYVYGFINYGVYNYLDGTKISGLNGIILKDFNQFSGLSLSYTRYNSINKLMRDFNDGKVDFVFNIAAQENFKTETYKTVNIFDKKLVVLSNVNNMVVVDNINSLINKSVLTIKNSYIENYLIDKGIKVISYNNVEDLVKEFNNKNIAILDLENYNFYKSSYLKDSKINYIFNMDDSYNFVINDKEENKLFKSIFNFYLSFNSINKLVSNNYADVAYQNINISYILIIIICLLLTYIILDFSSHLIQMKKTIRKNKKEKVKLTKEEKIMYIDQLTSLKNRTYFNSRIESWDDSEVYPQAIIVVDLNNIAYINDNYGREEGDKVITEAANIFIQHQLSNSEIIRTDGDEFLIYLVGYTEKQIISYLRKLNKEFKNLSHGFGASSGYSIITDAIKTIDDAVNEATIAMKENKEDIEY